MREKDAQGRIFLYRDICGMMGKSPNARKGKGEKGKTNHCEKDKLRKCACFVSGITDTKSATMMIGLETSHNVPSIETVKLLRGG